MQASAVEARGLSKWGSWALKHRLNNVVHGLSCSMACGILPIQGSNTCLLHCQQDSLPLSLQENPVGILKVSVKYLEISIISKRMDNAFIYSCVGSRKVWLHIFYVCLNHSLKDLLYLKFLHLWGDWLIKICLRIFLVLSPAHQETTPSVLGKSGWLFPLASQHMWVL